MEERYSYATGGEGPTQLSLYNLAYQSKAFRKLHLETAIGGNGLQVVHCVMYPRAETSLPICAMDAVGWGDNVTLCIADVCPSTEDLTVPAIFNQRIPKMQSDMQLEGHRAIPEWGQQIFSKHCLCMRPSSPEEVAIFVEYALGIAQLTVDFGEQQIEAGVGSESTLVAERLRCYRRFCDQQCKNDKTTRILQATFGPDFAQQYLEHVLFDGP